MSIIAVHDISHLLEEVCVCGEYIDSGTSLIQTPLGRKKVYALINC